MGKEGGGEEVTALPELSRELEAPLLQGAPAGFQRGGSLLPRMEQTSLEGFKQRVFQRVGEAKSQLLRIESHRHKR